MKLVDIRLKKRKSANICAHDGCKIKEGLVTFQHPIGLVQLCIAHAGTLDTGEEKYIVPDSAKGPPVVQMSDDGQWYLDKATNSWKPASELPPTPAPAPAPTLAPTPAAAPAAPTPHLSPDGKWYWDFAKETWLEYTPPAGPPTPASPAAVAPHAPSPAILPPVPTPAPARELSADGQWYLDRATNSWQPNVPVPMPAAAEIVKAADPTSVVVTQADVTDTELATRRTKAEEMLAFVKTLPVESNEAVEKCAAFLKDVKSRQEWLDAAKEAVLKPILEAKAAAEAVFADHQKPLAAIDDTLRKKVTDYVTALTVLRKELQDGLATGRSTPAQLAQVQLPSFEHLSVSQVWEAEVEDLEKVVPLYVTKELNKKLVLEHARAAEAAGTKLELAGLKIFKKPRVNVLSKPKKAKLPAGAPAA